MVISGDAIMNDMVSKVVRFYDLVVKYAILLFLTFIALTLFSNVFFRYVLYSAFTWAEELTLFVLIWIAGLAARPALKAAEFINIDFLPERLKTHAPALGIVMELVAQLVILIYSSVITVAGIELCIRVLPQQSSMLGISMAIPYAAIPFAGANMVLTSLGHVVQTVRRVPEGETTP